MKNKKRVAIITGSTSGIGFETAKKFVENGDRVTIFCRHDNHVREAQEELLQIGKKNQVLGITGDTRDADDVSRIVRETLAKFGDLDILINNAGTAVWKPIENTNETELHDIINTNLIGYYHFIREVIPFFKKENKGRIINISSGLGESGAKNYTAYSASKFGVNGLTEALAYELEDTDVGAYTVMPGAVATPLHKRIHPKEDTKTMMTPEYIANVIFETAESKKKNGAKIRIYSKK